ncbi:MAG: PKD domain-containing protein [Gemmatimonadota bacterium]
MTAASHHSCALETDGSVACWGLDGIGETRAPSGTFTQVSTGFYHTCAIDTDEALVCWGDNRYGQGDAPEGTFTQVSAGDFHSCAVRTDGGLACWGLGGSGQTTTPAGTFTQVDAGTYHNCALTPAQNVVCWGFDEYGRTNDPAGTFTQVSAGWRTNCAVRADASVRCWGYHAGGMWDVPAGSYQQVSVSRLHVCGVTTDYGVQCWGNNGSGEGSPPRFGPNTAPTASAGGPYDEPEGWFVRFDGSASSDADGDDLTFAWSFGDDATGTGATPSHAYADDGTYAVSVVVSDGVASDETSTTATIRNVAPSASAGDVTVTSGMPATAAGFFSDPGQLDRPWSYVFEWTDDQSTTGSTDVQRAAVRAQHLYCEPGHYGATFSVTDKDGGMGSAPFAVTVLHRPVTVYAVTERIALRGAGVVLVAILSAPGFDAARVDIATVTLGDGARTETPADGWTQLRDVDRDGDLDRVVRFPVRGLVEIGDLTSATRSLVLNAALDDGCTLLRGSATVQVQ